MASVNVPGTFGALLVGGFLALALSGVVVIQASLYFKTYRSDPTRTKLLVAAILLLDVCHSGLVCASLWIYLITDYGRSADINNIPRTVALSIVFTAILTFLVQCFFANRIYRFSHQKWYIAGPIVVIALFRLSSASVTTSEMLRLGSFTEFTAHYKWVFTLGLALSSLGDVLITTFLCYFLRINRTGSISLNHVMDLLVVYAVENGSITCASTIISMICWLTMPHNRIFLGLHFVISKLYANSLLATLNARQQLRHGRSASEPVVFRDDFGLGRSRSDRSGMSGSGQGRQTPALEVHRLSDGTKFSPSTTMTSTKVQINVEKIVEVDRGSSESNAESNV